MKEDMFDRLMKLPLLRVFQPFCRRHKEALLYLFFGGLAFIVSMATFALFYEALSCNELVANVLSWIITVLFAFFTNRIWVFSSPTNGMKELFRQMASFFAGRVATLALEELILLVFVTWLKLAAIPVKVAAQVIVILLNYVISKRVVFKR